MVEWMMVVNTMGIQSRQRQCYLLAWQESRTKKVVLRPPGELLKLCLQQLREGRFYKVEEPMNKREKMETKLKQLQ